jgi:hypothetical protein
VRDQVIYFCMSQQNLRHRNTDQSERITSYHLLLKFPLSQASPTSLIHAASKVGGSRPKGKKTTATDAAVQGELDGHRGGKSSVPTRFLVTIDVFDV